MDGHRSSRPVMVLLLAAITNSALGQSQRSYFAIGEPLVLTPPERSTPITGIVWTHNTDLVAEWLGGEPVYYGGFKGRTTLDMSTGILNITKTERSDEGLLKVEINNKLLGVEYNATAIQKVRTPSFVLRTLVCSPNFTDCAFSCQGDSTGAGPVTYSWRKDQGPWEPEQESPDIIIKNEKMSGVTLIWCRMKNPVSQEESNSVGNPFYVEEVPNPPSPGLIAFLCILFLVVLPGAGVGVWKREDIKKKFCGKSV
ncbi:uncharacterized protein [Paralichthys olivaceus]|uniref:uncharacterized protein n=1 Tax=Paralichthys olivaceus TaxID=8255 RepID=UPI00375325E8